MLSRLPTTAMPASRRLRLGLTLLSVAAGFALSSGLAAAAVPTVDVAAKPKVINKGATKVTFSADESGTYELRLGGTDCTTGAPVAGESGNYDTPEEVEIVLTAAQLAEGANTIRVCITNGDGTGHAAIVVTKDTRPQTVLTKKPASPDSSSSATFEFSSPTGVSFECSLDGGPDGGPVFSPCTSPRSYTALFDDTHVFSVRAVNALGKRDPTPAAWVWEVDTVEPDTLLVAGPSGTIIGRNAAIEFGASETGVSFECKRNSGLYVACASPVSYAGLADGDYTVLVRAIDDAGNVDSTPLAVLFVVDAPPETSILAGPLGSIATTSATFVLGSTTSSDTFECSLDHGSYYACPSPYDVTGLAPGDHTLAVRAVDAGGERDPSPAQTTWTVVTLAATPVAYAANVRRARVKTGDHRVRLTWARPRDGDFRRVEIVRIPGKKKAARSLVYRGNKRAFIDRGLKNGSKYMWVIYATDRAGNRSGGIRVEAITPARARLGTRANVRPQTPLVFWWRPVKKARFYNFQLFRGQKKVLSSWPSKPSVSLSGSWNWEGS